MTDEILKVDNVHKSYAERDKRLDVLRGVSFSLRRGEVACLMGESGSGKTTLLNLLGSLDHPDQGNIIFNGEDLTALKGPELARFRNGHIGFLFQFHYLLSDFTALENAIMPGLIGGRPRAGLEARKISMPSSGLGASSPMAAAKRLPFRPPVLGRVTPMPFLYVPGSRMKRASAGDSPRSFVAWAEARATQTGSVQPMAG